jgi:hypothetical protein
VAQEPTLTHTLTQVKERHLAEMTKHKRRLSQLEATAAQAESVVAASATRQRPRSAMPPVPGATGGELAG